ncbi:N,N-dimethylformamidase beta subunit family domain-containing protein [Streptomyces sp. WAC05374]|uniref:N,N-dimethylformamidase beta subunit family domain-containing protein n=1 Tax=Streptomyces sp. WAC05374 TaxID=2487420 RepID=UPI00163C91EC|nr:N,N-dimethylformamidase beta subunit family domain-containing protein [Streptomyces sp. WAC05374]
MSPTSPMSRRTALGVLGLGAAGVAGLTGCADTTPPVRKKAASGNNPVTAENSLTGSGGWHVPPDGRHTAKDRLGQIQGYASATSVGRGETIAFHVSLRKAQPFTVTVHRIGHYGGTGGRSMVTSPELPGAPRPTPKPDPDNGAIVCDWPVSWTLTVPDDWTSGAYVAVFTAEDGHRSLTPFVVREPARPSDLLVVLPFATYQAYNQWPLDGRTGKNLYKGYARPGVVGDNKHRAFRVSFDRPYSDHGLPRWAELDLAFIRWVERHGYDATYATSTDLHEGRVDPAQYTAMVFPGHDEYWSKPMRDVVESAVDQGTHVAFLAANNIYFHVRLADDAHGTPCRAVVCHKQDHDPHADENGPTTRWRDLPGEHGEKHGRAEQGLLGVQYNGILAEPAPLVVREPAHWFWSGTGLRDGEEIAGLVGVEADGHNPKMPSPRGASRTLLSESPYGDTWGKGGGRGRRVQNTSLTEHADGTLVFVAGTFHWSLALGDPAHAEPRVQRATKNLLDRMLTPRT